MPMVKAKKLPDMTDWSDEQIHEFWKTHDSADYWHETEPVEVKAAPKEQRAVSIKLDAQDVAQLEALARERGVELTTLIRLWIKEKLRRRQGSRSPQARA